MYYTHNQRMEALETLRQLLKRGDVVYTIRRHSSESGMSHMLSVLRWGKGGPESMSLVAAALLGRPTKSVNGRLSLKAYGDDPEEQTVRELSEALFGETDALYQEPL